MLDVVPTEIVAVFMAVVAAVIGFIAGGRSSTNRHRAKQAEKDKEAVIRRKELEDEVENLSDDDRRKRLDKWVR